MKGGCWAMDDRLFWQWVRVASNEMERRRTDKHVKCFESPFVQVGQLLRNLHLPTSLELSTVFSPRIMQVYVNLVPNQLT
jgi:hypothetical protein